MSPCRKWVVWRWGAVSVSVSRQTLVKPAAAAHVTMERNTAQYNLKTNNNSNSKVASLDVDEDLGKR